MNFNPQNILVLHFGQLGDVILSLPALFAIRKRFPDAHITALAGKGSVQIIELADFFDEIISVDRVELRDSGKLWSIAQIFKIVGNIRRKKFDFIIDLHSLYETNLLGFFSGAKQRLFANRESRSLDFLANFEPKPPREDKTKNATDFYLDVLQPLGIENAERFVQIHPPKSDVEIVENLWRENKIGGSRIVGLYPGAGNPSRRWSLDKFAELARLLVNDAYKVIVFLGPEEKDWQREIEKKFPDGILIFDKLTIPQLAEAFTRLQILISNDTGPMHLAAIIGTHVVLLLHENAPTIYIPLSQKLEIVRGETLDKISAEEVFQTTRNVIAEIEAK